MLRQCLKYKMILHVVELQGEVLRWTVIGACDDNRITNNLTYDV